MWRSHHDLDGMLRIVQVFNAGQQEPYEGGRSASDIVEFAKEKAGESKAAPEVVELTSQDNFAADCTNHQARLS